MAVKDMVLDLAIRYGFQVLGALLILAVGALAARSIGQFVDQRLQKQLEPPMRLLIVRVLKVVVMLFAIVAAAVDGVVKGNARVLKDPAPVIGIAQVTESGIRVAIEPWVRVVDVGVVEAEIYRALVQEFRARQIDLGVMRQEVRLVNA